MVITSSPPVIDIEALIAPISAEKPAGESLQYEGTYDEIREARRADDNLSQGQWQRELKVADFRKVVSLATAALQTKTKDLQIGSWLTESLVSENGFPGLRDGLKLMSGLQENFWETLFPEIDEGDDMEARANAFEFLDRQTAIMIKEISLTSVDNLNYYKWEESKSFDIPDNVETLDFASKEKYKALQIQINEEKRVTGGAWRVAKNQSPRIFYEERFLVLEECWEAFTALDRIMDEKFGRQTPGLNALKKSLDDVRTIIKRLVEEKREAEPDPSDNLPEEAAAAEGAATGGAAVTATGIATATGAIQSRQDALKRLTDVSDFFRKTEPHSPVAYLVQKAVRWGNMPLETWLQEVIKDTTVLGQLRETLGVTPPE